MRTVHRPCHRCLAPVVALLVAGSGAGAQIAVGGALRTTADSMTAVAPGATASVWAVGGSRAVIDSADIAGAAATTLSELIQARAPSVSVLRGGGLLTQSGQIRMRGPTSVLSPALPLLIVDGIPMSNAEDDTIGVASRLDDIPLADVARIEILRGPAAAALYGAGAAAGVIVVTTRDGGAHSLRWQVSGDASASRLPGGFGSFYEGVGISTANGAPLRDCGLFAIEQGTCIQTGVLRANVYRSSGLFRTGLGVGSSVAASGGSARTHGRLSVARRDANGVTRDDEASRTSARLDLSQRILPSLGATARVGFVRGRSRPSSNEIVLGQVLGRFGPMMALDSLRSFTDSVLAVPALVGHLDHLTTGLALDWHPLSPITLRGVVSRDRVDERGNAAQPFFFGTVLYDTVTSTSTLRETRAELEGVHRLAGAAATLVAGVEHLHASWGERSARVLSNGAFSIVRRWVPKGNTNALYLHERLGWGDRAAVGAGARYERDYLAGDEWRIYPTADGTLRVASDWHGGAVRVRGAYGEAPQRAPSSCSPYPGPASNPFTWNFDCAPERSRETELGADATFRRVSVALTGFQSRVSGLWVPVPGNAPAIQRERLRTQGIELETEALVLDRPGMQWSIGLVGASIGSRLRAPGYPDVRYGTGGTLDDGSPVWAMWRSAYSYADTNGNGLIDFNEVTLSGPRVVGGSTPTLEAALHSTIAVGRQLSFGVIVDARRGYYADDALYAYECSRQHCLATVDPSTSAADQARALVDAVGYAAPENASFWRLRELSARWRFPAVVAGRLGASDGAIVVAGRDLATRTSFPVGDPEVNDNQPQSVVRAVGASIPLPRQFLFRVELGYGAR